MPSASCPNLWRSAIFGSPCALRCCSAPHSLHMIDYLRTGNLLREFGPLVDPFIVHGVLSEAQRRQVQQACTGVDTSAATVFVSPCGPLVVNRVGAAVATLRAAAG